MPTGTLTVVKTVVDTFSNKLFTTTNYGQNTFISLNGHATNTRNGYLWFPRPFPLNATVFEATLKLRLFAAWTGANIITARRVEERWGELSLTWANNPAATTLNSSTATVTGEAAGYEVQIDLTDMMNDVAAGEPWFGVMLSVDTTATRNLAGSEHPNQTFRGLLEIDWGVLPHAPVNLNPVGNQAVSVAEPTLDWQFASPDHTAIRRQSYSQVQINDSADFTSPDYDSGWEANTTSQWDLSQASSPDFTPLTDGQEVYWRVRVKDDQGLESDWSPTVRFKRTTKGTLTVTNPPVAPGNVVNDLTPTFAWNLSGRTQEGYEINFFQMDGNRAIPKWRLPRRVSTVEEYTLPKGYIKSTEQYEIQIKVWDTIDRVTTPGDNDFNQVTREFTYDRAGGPDSVTNLTAVSFGPGVILTWHRTSAPDFFCVVVDGEEILSRIDPDDVLFNTAPGDLTYQMVFWRATPGATHTYEVEAVENTAFAGVYKHSAANDTDTATTDPTGIHLVDESDDTHVVVYGLDDASFERRITSTVYDLIGTSYSPQIVDAIGGYSATLSGLLQGAAQRDLFENTLVGRIPAPLRLIISDTNMEVELQAGSASPTPKPGRDLFECNFTFQQRDAAEQFDVVGG